MATGGANDIELAPVNVLWQIEENEEVDFAGLSDLDGVYWTLNAAKDTTQYYVWYNLDASSVDPAPAGLTAIEVAVTTGDSASTIASSTATAIDGVGDFDASADGTKVNVFRTAVGDATDSADVDAGVAITKCRDGKDFDLGLLDGDVELSFSPSNFIVQSHQTGTTPRAALFQGIDTAEVTTTMQETKQSKLEELYTLYGGSLTPAGGTKVFGIGTSKQGKNLLVNAARLVLRPVNAPDNTTDSGLALAVPVPDTLTFSGENPRLLSVTWSGFIDDQLNNNISGLFFGDVFQGAGLRS